MLCPTIKFLTRKEHLCYKEEAHSEHMSGVFKALYEKIGLKEGFNKLFDIVAGTSSGAMNGAILASHVIENGTWEGSLDKLNAFWKYISIYIQI
ncbi:MAG: patatin-like phospholipase family protein [Candidatus Nitrosopolaris sp.]